MRRIVILVIMFNGFKGQVGFTSVGAMPYPQWGVPAAADAANAIDAERFQKIAQHLNAAQHESTLQNSQHPNHISHSDAQSSLVPTSVINHNPELSPSSARTFSKNRNLDCDHEHHHFHHEHQISPEHPELEETSRRRTIRRKQHQRQQQPSQHPPGYYYNQYQTPQRSYYPQRGYYSMPEQPLQNWGFWKWGQDNVNSFWSALFS